MYSDAGTGGGAGGSLAPPISGRSVNLIQTTGGITEVGYE